MPARTVDPRLNRRRGRVGWRPRCGRPRGSPGRERRPGRRRGVGAWLLVTGDEPPVAASCDVSDGRVGIFSNTCPRSGMESFWGLSCRWWPVDWGLSGGSSGAFGTSGGRGSRGCGSRRVWGIRSHARSGWSTRRWTARRAPTRRSCLRVSSGRCCSGCRVRSTSWSGCGCGSSASSVRRAGWPRVMGRSRQRPGWRAGPGAGTGRRGPRRSSLRRWIPGGSWWVPVWRTGR